MSCKGWRTLAAALGCVFMGVLQMSAIVDFRAMLAPFISDQTLLGSVVAVLGLVFGVLRFVTTSPMFKSEEAA